MRPQQIREWLQRRPFQPFRLCLTDGTSYEVRHPDTMVVGSHAVVVGVGGAPSGNGDLPDLFVQIAILHVVRLEPLQAPAQT